MLSMIEIKRTARKIKKELQKQVKLVESNFETIPMKSLKGLKIIYHSYEHTSVSMLVKEYNKTVITAIIYQICEKFDVDKNHLELILRDDEFVIQLYSDES